MNRFLYSVGCFLLLVGAVRAEEPLVLASVSEMSAARFMPLDAVRAGIPSGNSLRPVARDQAVSRPSGADSVVPTVVGNTAAKPGFMPIRRDAVVPAPSRGVPIMPSRLRIGSSVAVGAMPNREVPEMPIRRVVNGDRGSSLLDLFDNRNATASNNFYDAMRGNNRAR